MDTKINFAFLATLQDPVRAVEWCMAAGLIADKYECPMCGEQMKLKSSKGRSDGLHWRCQINGHDVRRGLRKKSWFDNSNLSIHKILMIVYMWCMKVPNDTITIDLGISTDTTVNWKSFCRAVCVDACVKNNEILGGDGAIVEIAESKFGKSKYHRGSWVEERWVFGGVERGTNKCFMEVVKERSKDALLNVVRKYVKHGTTIISDCWKSYKCLQDKDFLHFAETYSVNFKEPDNNGDMNSIDGTWGAIKRQIGGNHNKGQFDTYLYEYMWRRRHINNKKELVNIFLREVIELYPPVTKDNEEVVDHDL